MIVEDDPACAQYMSLTFRSQYDDIRTASNANAALLELEARVADLILLDMRLPDMDGLQLLTLIKERWPHAPVVFVTAAADITTVVEAVRRGATNYLVKPVAPAALLSAARALAGRPSAAPPRDIGVPEIVGTSPGLVRVRHLVTLAARSEVHVLLTGETGTGKELAARAIHRLSGVHGGPFVAHNCATTPADLFDSEFFGHVRGAFTGADRDHAGLLARASGGTLFLDELESFGLRQQAKLLRVLDDGEMRPVGSSVTQVVSVRFISASNRDPRGMIRDGSLREDLYYRLAGAEIRLPPLREHAQDIPELAARFLGGSAHKLTPGALETLGRFSWPGNVRQLRNVLAYALTVAGHDEIDERHLHFCSGAQGGPDRSLLPDDDSLDTSTRTLEDLEHRALAEALRASQGHRGKAARALGIHRSTLRRKLRKLGAGSSD